MSTSGVNSTNSSNSTGSSSSSSTKSNRLEDMGMDDFLKMLITELQSQDPLNPMDNAQMVEQISQIRAIESNTKLTSTLDAVSLGQSIATASNLIGREIKGLTSDGTRVTGTVDRVTVTDGKPQVHIGDSTIDLNNVEEIVAGTSST